MTLYDLGKNPALALAYEFSGAPSLASPIADKGDREALSPADNYLKRELGSDAMSVSPDTRDTPRLVTDKIEKPKSDKDKHAAVERLYGDLCNKLTTSAKDRTASLRRLTALRRANEELQNCFFALERKLPGDANTIELVFADEQKTGDAKLSLSGGSTGLAQVLPVSSTGVSAIEVLLCDIRPIAGAVLHVHLVSLEDSHVIDRWTVPVERLVDGWTMFSLTRPIVGSTRTLELRLNMEGEQEANISVQLGARQPARNFQVRNPMTDAALQPNGMAVRVWCGPSDSAHATRTNIVIADARSSVDRRVVHVPLAPNLLGKASHANAGDVIFDFVPVSSLPNEVGMACHPPAEGMTIACLPMPRGYKALAVSADAAIGNPRSKPVQFAIVIADDIDRATALFEGRAKPTSDEAFSGWVSNPASERKPVAASLARPDALPAQVFLATRMERSGNNNFAWARFRNFGLQVVL